MTISGCRSLPSGHVRSFEREERGVGCHDDEDEISESRVERKEEKRLRLKMKVICEKKRACGWYIANAYIRQIQIRQVGGPD